VLELKKTIFIKICRNGISYTTLGTSYEKGTGLGLILCKEIIEKLGGQIWVKNKNGKGTEVSFTLKNGRIIN
jgi:two-component system, sensor histidine kinase and response regulator